MESVEPFEPFIPNENARKWADALESGDFQQTRGVLHKIDAKNGDSFCCLGVACVVAIREGVELPTTPDYEGTAMLYGTNSAATPQAVADWLGLRSDLGAYGGARSLAEDNDSYLHDFKRIAMTIRTTPSLFREPGDDS